MIKLKHKDGKEFSSRVLSEGTLRLLALSIMQFDDQYIGLLCFEEPENGIHPQRIKLMTQLLFSLSADFDDEKMPLRQIIINTHSPILVREMLKFKAENGVSIWLSKMITLVTDFNGTRVKLKSTIMTRVKIDNQYSLPDIPANISIVDLEEYLNTLKDESESSRL